MRTLLLGYLLSFSFLIIAQTNESYYDATAYYEAVKLTENYPHYQQFIRSIEQRKDSLLQHTTIDHPVLKFQSTEDEQTLIEIDTFLKNPSKIPTDLYNKLQQFDEWANGTVTIPIVIKHPFLDKEKRLILDQNMEPIGKYDATTCKIYSDVHYFIPMGIVDKQPIHPDALIAIYNPVLKTFHAKKEDFFDLTPIAHFNTYDARIYEGTSPSSNQYSSIERVVYTAFDYESNEIYQTTSAALPLFLYRGKEQVEIATLQQLSIPTSISTAITPQGPLRPISRPPSISNSSTIGPTFPSIAIDAIAQFLVDRVKEELLLAFFDRFLKKMQASAELRTLFPNTYFLLETQDLFRLPAMGELWVSAFQTDIQSMLDNTEQLLSTNPKYSTIANDPTIKAFRGSHQFMQLYKEEEFALVEVLQQLQDSYQTASNKQDPIAKALEILATFAQELRVKDEQAILSTDILKPQALTGLSSQTATYFVAFFYTRHTSFLEKLSNDTPYDIQAYLLNYPFEFIQQFSKCASLLQRIHKKKSLNQQTITASKKSNPVPSFAQDIYQLLNFGLAMQFFNTDRNYYASEAYLKYTPIIRSTLQAVEALEQESSGMFLLHLVQILEPIFGKQLPLSKEGKLQKVTPLIKDILFYSSFMVDILNAQSSEQVNGLLQQYALPVGSYRLKRNATFSLEVNAYPGVYLGLEQGLNNQLSTQNILGITAPIGLAFNWGKSEQRDGHAFGAFFPVIDIGAAFSYRWSGEAGGFPSQLSWRQVMSPGLHGVWGIKNIPISLMVGTQFTPQLRTIEAQGVAGTKQSVWRFGVSLVVDIPIFNLYLRE